MARKNKHTGAKFLAMVTLGVAVGSQTQAGQHAARATLTSISDAGSPAANMKLGQEMAAAKPYYWTGSQLSCLDTLWQGESGWSATADTRQTRLDAPGAAVYAYGIPQARPASKMAAAGADWATNPATQIKWGLRYVYQTYGSPCSALAAKRASGNKGY